MRWYELDAPPAPAHPTMRLQLPPAVAAAACRLGGLTRCRVTARSVARCGPVCVNPELERARDEILRLHRMLRSKKRLVARARQDLQAQKLNVARQKRTVEDLKDLLRHQQTIDVGLDAAVRRTRPGTDDTHLVESLARTTEYPVHVLVGKSRRAPVAAARHSLWRYLRAAGWSLPRIARAFNRDHTTVLYGVRKFGAPK